MNRTLTSAVRGALVALALTPIGCKGKPSSNESAAAAASASPAASAAASASASAAAAAPTGSVPDPSQVLSLMDRIAAEGRNRPAIKPNADDILGNFAKGGATFTRVRPSLAATYKARYCTGGYVGGETLALNVCEFADAADTATGFAYAKTVFPNMKNRKVWSSKMTTLTIIEQKSDAAALALEKKLVAEYVAL